MDNKFETQSGGHLKEGHESSDLSVRGIVISGVLLVAGALFSFVLVFGLIRLLEHIEKANDAKLSPMEQQLQQERNPPKEGLGKVTPTHKGEIKPAPDWYERGKTEDYLNRTFTAPRLQYDDEHDLGIFRGSEDDWLSGTGKDAAGNIHIPIDRAMDILAKQGLPQVSGPFLPSNVGAPSAAYPTGASSTGQPAPSNTGGAKK